MNPGPGLFLWIVTIFLCVSDATRQLVVATVHLVGQEYFATPRAKLELMDKTVWRGVAAKITLLAIILQVKLRLFDINKVKFPNILRSILQAIFIKYQAIT